MCIYIYSNMLSVRYNVSMLCESECTYLNVNIHVQQKNVHNAYNINIYIDVIYVSISLFAILSLYVIIIIITTMILYPYYVTNIIKM